jgi:hypothetical protein
MAVFTGYMALGTGIVGGVFQEVSGGSYAREALALVGSGQAGLSQALASIAAAAAPAGAPMRLGAFFDTLTGGNLLAYFELPAPLTDVGVAFPATTINVAFENTIATAFSQGTSDLFAAGTQLGNVNGAPLVAGTNLALSNGNLYAEPGNHVINNPLFMMNGTIVARFDTAGNLQMKGSVVANPNP